MNTQGAERMFNTEAALLDYVDILRSSSALVAEEANRIPLERRREFERRVSSHMSEVALCLRDFVVNLGQEIGTYSRGDWEGSKKRWHPLRAQSERAVRQVELVRTSDPLEALSTLQWMVEQGRIEELRILSRLRERPSPFVENSVELFDLAEQRIKQRVSGNEGEIEISTDASIEGEAMHDLKMLLQNYHNRPISERGQVLSQAVIAFNSLALRSRDTSEPRGSLGQSATRRSPALLANDAQQLLLEALRDPKPAVRREAAGALGEWGDEESVAPLILLLSQPTYDENESVRRACAGTLGQIGGPAAVRALIAAAEQDPAEAVRRDAIYALIELAVSEDEEAGDLIKQEVVQAMERVSRSPREGEFLRRKAQSLVELLMQPV